MQIVRPSSSVLELKLKQATVILSPESIKVGSVTVDGPGEYDIAGVAIKGMALEHQTLFFLNAEDIRICCVLQQPEKLTQTIKEELGNIDLAVVPVTAEAAIADTVTLINDLEPAAVIPIGGGNIDEFAKTMQASGEVQDSIKITKAQLYGEERQVFLLKSLR